MARKNPSSSKEQCIERQKEVIEDGDIVLLFSDGVTEAMNANGEMFGQERLEQALNQYADLPIRKILAKIIDDVSSFQKDQYDDMSLVIAKKCPVTR